MNWKKRYEEIKPGDMVRCIQNTSPLFRLGGGWREGKEFTVKSITKHKTKWNGASIIWPDDNGSGVYSDCVVKI